MIEHLLGKTITGVGLIGCERKTYGPKKPCDSMNTLVLHFSDGTSAKIIGSYQGYTGKSCAEYRETIEVTYEKT